MTPDHKTVREALERIKFYSDDRKAVVLAEDALAALDRIEAVEMVTEQQIQDEMVKSLDGWKLHGGNFGDAAAKMIVNAVLKKYPNGLRIVKEK